MVKCTYCAVQEGKLVEKLGPSVEMTGFYADLCFLSGIWQFFSLSEKYYRNSLDLLKQLQSPEETVFVTIRLAQARISAGDWENAIVLAKRCIEAATVAGDIFYSSMAMTLLGFCELMFGHIDQCMQLFREAAELTAFDLVLLLWLF